MCTTTTAGNGVGMSTPSTSSSSTSSTTRTLKRMVRVVQKIPLTLKRVLFTRFRYSHLPASTQCGDSEDGFRLLRVVRRGRWRWRQGEDNLVVVVVVAGHGGEAGGGGVVVVVGVGVVAGGGGGVDEEVVLAVLANLAERKALRPVC